MEAYLSPAYLRSDGGFLASHMNPQYYIPLAVIMQVRACVRARVCVCVRTCVACGRSAGSIRFGWRDGAWPHNVCPFS